MANEKRAMWHLQLGVCRTKRGLKTHLKIIGYNDLRLLMAFLHCSLGNLTDKAWRFIKPVKEQV